MRRAALLRKIGKQASMKGVGFGLVREGGSHSLYQCGAVRVIVPRHSEINELTAHGILAENGVRSRKGVVAVTAGVRSYRATARRSGEWWAITVPELRGVFTQARRLDQVAGMAREAVALFLGLDAEAVTITVEPVLPAPATSAVQAVQRARVEAQAAADRLATAQAAAVRELVGTEHLSSRDAAAVLGISHQRVSQISRDGPARAAG
jgi:predicted RNA binding protein YcfA (HicA-like mRNA interferase family)/predicted RNase H-like HicB family nuclease